MQYEDVEPEYVAEAKAFERVSMYGERFVPEKGKAFIQAKTSVEYAIGQIRMFLDEYAGRTTPARSALEVQLINLPNLQYLNPKLLVVAAVFNYYNAKLTRRNFDRFLEQHTDIDNPKADFLRYIRFIRLKTGVDRYGKEMRESETESELSDEGKEEESAEQSVSEIEL